MRYYPIIGLTILSLLAGLPAYSSAADFFAPVITQGAFEHFNGRLVLRVQGKAPLVMQGARLKAGVFYQKQACTWCTSEVLTAPSSDKDFIPFELVFTAFSRPACKTLSGRYTVKLFFVLAQQPPAVVTRVRPLLQGRGRTITQQTFTWGDAESYAQEDKTLATFYAQRLCFFLLLWIDLSKQSGYAMRLPFSKKNNPYAKMESPNSWPRALDVSKWKLWLKKWGRWLAAEQELLRQHRRRYVALRYPRLFQHYERLYPLLWQLSGQLTRRVYRANGLLPAKQRRSARGRDSHYLLIRQLRQELKCIRESFDFQKIVDQCQQFMCNGSQKLGYSEAPDFAEVFQLPRSTTRREE